MPAIPGFLFLYLLSNERLQFNINVTILTFFFCVTVASWLSCSVYGMQHREQNIVKSLSRMSLSELDGMAVQNKFTEEVTAEEEVVVTWPLISAVLVAVVLQYLVGYNIGVMVSPQPLTVRVTRLRSRRRSAAPTTVKSTQYDSLSVLFETALCTLFAFSWRGALCLCLLSLSSTSTASHTLRGGKHWVGRHVCAILTSPRLHTR